MIVQLWGPNNGGGYYAMEMDGEGHVGIPTGRAAYERFARHAPDELVAQAVKALEAERDRRATARGPDERETSGDD